MKVQLRALAIVALVTMGLLGRPTSAAAQTHLYLNLPGVIAIGTVAGRTIAATLSLFGCTYQDLAPATFTTEYVLHGTAFNETINVITTTTSWCNVILQPINLNGHSLQTYGGAGDDVIYGGGYSQGSGNGNWIWGEAGNDTLYLGPGGAEANGGDGNDKVYGADNANDLLLGGAGNDALCEHSNHTPLWQDGGDGTDTACAQDTTHCSHCAIFSIERFTCTPCGLGY